LQSNSCICVQNATITFYDVQPEDAGRYCCKTHNGFGDVKFSVEFVVKEDLLPSYQMTEGMPVVLKYQMHSSNIAWSYKWSCNGQELLSTSPNETGQYTSTLTIMRMTDCMKYSCIAESEDESLSVPSISTTVMGSSTSSDESIIPADYNDIEVGREVPPGCFQNGFCLHGELTNLRRSRSNALTISFNTALQAPRSPGSK
jgi:hypothetical protein